MPADHENCRNLAHHGIKEAQGFVKLVDHPARAHNDIPDAGICGAPLNADPHGRGFKMPVHNKPETRRPVGEPAAMTPPHDSSPHPATPAAQKQAPNTYGKVPR